MRMTGDQQGASARQPPGSSSPGRRGGVRQACRGRRSRGHSNRYRQDVLFPVSHPSPALGASQPATAPWQHAPTKQTRPLSRIPQRRPVNCCGETCAERVEAAAFRNVSIPCGSHSTRRPPHGWCGGGKVSGWVVWRNINHVDDSPMQVVFSPVGDICKRLCVKMGGRRRWGGPRTTPTGL